MTAREIVEAMPITPRIVNSVGEACKTPKGTPLEGNYKETYLAFPLDAKGHTSIPSYLTKVLKEPFATAKIIEDIVRTGGKADFYISIYCGENAGFTLPVSLLVQLAEKKMAVGFDIYPEKHD